MTDAGRWLRCWSVVAALGVGASFLIWSPAVILLLWLCAVFCAALMLVLLSTTPGAPGLAVDRSWTWIAARSALGGAGFVAVCAVGVVSPVLATTLVVLVALTAPAVVSQARRLVRGGPTVDPAPLDSRIVVPLEQVRPLPRVLPETAVRQLTNRDLCLEWRRSFTALQLATGPAELMHVVVVRQVYLDEMDRRSPMALQAWLESGARAAGGPERFLGEDPDEPVSPAA